MDRINHLVSLDAPRICSNATWVPNGITIVGNRGSGAAADQLDYPQGIYLTEDGTVFVTDSMEWEKHATSGKVVAGGNGRGNQTNQLNLPSSVIVDKETDTLIICDWANRRVIRWSLRTSTTNGEILISDIDCRGLAIDAQRNLFISDTEKHEVRRYLM